MNVERFSLALAEPLDTATTTIRRREGFLLRCDHRGVTGIGEATPLPDWTESIQNCETALERAANTVRGEGPKATLRAVPRTATAARHGLSTALLDADATAVGQPLSEWLAPDRPASSVPVNATIGDADTDWTADRARELVADGFDCLKCKVGARTVTEDVDRLGAIRDAVGNEVELRVDANGQWSREQADRALADLADYDVSLVEQPLPADDLAGLATLRGGPVDVAVDESLRNHGPAEILEADAADVLVLKPMVLGGPGEAHTIAGWAREQGLDVVVTTTIDAVVARTAAVHVAAAIPDVLACGLATGATLEDDLGPDPAPVTEGEIAVPHGDGLGLEAVSTDD